LLAVPHFSITIDAGEALSAVSRCQQPALGERASTLTLGRVARQSECFGVIDGALHLQQFRGDHLGSESCEFEAARFAVCRQSRPELA